ncbi:hypothetical protein [Pseudarthrobacter sp. NIBRBAC000502771]|uniref:hypothetical protein n=1 Tax=Pseudarthrobacter sp. NIBRBAC000502771 TaxID=2590774 RepID=UPI0011312A95|nr:hypothetical protein [Pseudarthrobacter sp. NIBRBAC000502771]QDG61220.1 hypothetical protein NIBR502771_02120 [Pseudarthrobacter sp. NIBRBAC000502771]
MARIRNIKPDFWTDEKLVELETWERLLFIGLWNFADDEGYMPYSPKRIKMQIFPGDSLEVSRGIQSLISIGAVELFDSEFGQVLHVAKWSKHQKVSNPSQSKYSSIELIPAGENPRKQAVRAPQITEPSLISTEDSVGLRTEREREGGRKKDLSSTPDEFDQWYSRYPKKEAKEAARKAFAKARKTVDLPALLEGVDRYAAATRDKDRQYLALPATWLNAGRWADELPEHTGQPGWTLGLDQ